MAEEIEIISTDNGMIVDANGFKGDTCLKELETVITELGKLGIKVTRRDTKRKVGHRVPSAGRSIRE